MTSIGLFGVNEKLEINTCIHIKFKQELTEIKTVVHKNRELLIYRDRVIGSNELSKSE